MPTKKTNNRKNVLYGIVIVLVIANFAFRLLNEMRIEQTAILFVGIPALITILLIKYNTTPKSAAGVVFSTVTLFLLLSSILLGEGMVCIIIMAPIFYMVAGIIVLIINLLKKRDKNKLNAYVLIPVLFILAQGYEINSAPELLQVKTVIDVKGHQNLNRFNKTPDFLKNYPNFFKIGFPEPIAIKGEGINVGDYRKIHFRSKTKGIGILHIKIQEKTKNSITFKVVNDNTHIHHWLSWKYIKVAIKHNKNNTSTITWNTFFTCDLGPSWYFKPTEKYGVQVMNTHLINSYFLN
ncbi:hypothetical protein [Pontimicrobium sp. MEBiC01747]